VISERAARSMLQIMQQVTDKGATGALAAIDGYPVAGKTGTAEKVVGGHYEKSRVVANFVGIVPADNPRLAIAVMIDEPQPAHYGGLVSAPVFKEIAEEALRYLGVPPSVPIVAKNARGKGHDQAAAAPAEEIEPEAEEEGVPAVAEGAGTDVPLPDDPGEEGAAAQDGHGEGGESPELVTLPNFTGMSIGEAIRAARRTGIELVVEGSGVAVGQVPAAGPRPRGSMCRVSFRPGG
jgi:cell division protein FtsI (penicillin-binding protein 3)